MDYTNIQENQYNIIKCDIIILQQPSFHVIISTTCIHRYIRNFVGIMKYYIHINACLNLTQVLEQHTEQMVLR